MFWLAVEVVHEGLSTVWVALIGAIAVVFVGVGAPTILAHQNSKTQEKLKTQEWARQDDLENRQIARERAAAEEVNKAAALLVLRQEEDSTRLAQAAALLRAEQRATTQATEKVAELAAAAREAAAQAQEATTTELREIKAGVGVVHTLVNQKLTDEQAKALRFALLALKSQIGVRDRLRELGEKPSVELLEQIEGLERSVNEMEQNLIKREEVQTGLDADVVAEAARQERHT